MYTSICIFEKYFQKLAFPFGLYYNNPWISFSV